MDHLILNNGSDGAALAEVALKALREARNSKTSSSGSIFVSDGQMDDDGIALGTGTIINGVDGGIQPWVGDTTPPGKPTGLSVSSKNAAVIVNWDGSMEGDKPLDWGHLQLLATDDTGNNYDFGVLYGAGSQQLANLTPGAKLTVWAVGYDDAHDADGNSTPNASTPSDNLTVTVASAVDPAAVQKAQDDAQSALNQAGQAITTSNDAKNAAQAAKDGNVTDYSQQYAQNSDTNTAPTTGWSDTAPSWVDGKYIWVRTVVTHGDGTTDTTDPIVVTGNNGAKGDTGAQGATGATGATGVSVSSITPYWAIASSAPAKPTEDTPPSPWSATEPAYNVGQNLYRTEKILYSDSSFSYTSVQLDSTYQYAALAKSTADGKNKIFSSASEPSHTGIMPGDLWFQLDTNKNVSGIKVWNGSAFTDMVLLANELLVASSVGTTQIADNAIVTGKIAANSVTSDAIAAHTITTDNIMAGQFQGYVFTGSVFQSSEAADTGIKINSTAVQMWDSAHNKTVYLDGEGKNNVLTGSFQTAATGNRVSINSQATSTIIGSSATLSGHAIIFKDNDFAASPQIGGYFTHSDLGDAPRITLLSGWKTDHDPAATLHLDSWPRSSGATGSGITSRAMMTANTDYTNPDSLKTDHATLDLQGIGGSGAYANLVAHAYEGSRAQTWVTATRNDGVTQVGIGTDAFTQKIYIGGKLSGITNQQTFQTNNWRIIYGHLGADSTIPNTTVALSPAKYGAYHAVASADVGWGSIFIHVVSTGSASQYQVMGYNAGAAYDGDIWVDTIAWLT